MKTIIIEDLPKILKIKRKLEKALEIKITTSEKNLVIDGTPENEYFAEKVIEAINFGFPYSHAIEIKNVGSMFEILNIKNYTPRKDFAIIRGRIIGKDGKTLKTLTGLTNCHFEINLNSIGIIGLPEEIKIAREGLISLIRGSKQANVYSFLEKHRAEIPVDLGLKDEKLRL